MDVKKICNNDNKRPSVEPSGTPLNIVSVLDLHLSISIDCRRSERCDLKQEFITPLFP